MDVSNTPTPPPVLNPKLILQAAIGALREISATRPSSLSELDSKVHLAWSNFFQKITHQVEKRGIKNPSEQSSTSSMATLQQPKNSKEEAAKKPTSTPSTTKSQKTKSPKVASDSDEDIWFDAEEEHDDDWGEVWFDAPEHPIDKSSSKKTKI